MIGEKRGSSSRAFAILHPLSWGFVGGSSVLYFLYMFGKKKEKVSDALLGVDIGTTAMKVVEFAPDGGRIRLVTYGYASIPVDGNADVLSLDDPKKIASMLRSIITASGMKAVRAVASLPAQSVFHAIISIPAPKSEKEDIRAAVEAQAGKVLPLPVAEMIIDSHIIDKDFLPKDGDTSEQKVKTVRVQVTAAPKALVEKYLAVFAAAKIELISLETEVFALMRSLIGKDTAKTMIVDIGGERTNICIAERGVPYLTRGIKSGGEEVTQAIASAMGMSIAEAESAKKDLAFGESSQISPVILAAIKPLLHEVAYASDLNAQENLQHPKAIEKIILTGGSAALSGFDRAMTDTLNVNVYVGDPWARVATPPEARTVLDEVGSRFAVAIGLAMRVALEKE